MSTKQCIGCGADYHMQSYDWPKNFAKRQFCSVPCRAKHGPKRQKRAPQAKDCQACGARFYRQRVGAERWNARQFCSSACASRGKPRETPWNITHGKSDDPVYKIWTAMKQRCLNENCQSWRRYGARGITVCPRWVESFDAFAKDMGPRPAGGTIERVNNNKGYEPGNCVWAPMSVQANNRDCNRVITVDGVSKTVRQWEQHQGFAKGVIASRVNCLGWPEREAVMVPPVMGQKIKRALA
jgi:hypothetical protein